MPPTGESRTTDGPQPLTLAQLAELADTSVATVSKVLNGKPQVSPQTRALVEGLIREHGLRRQRRPASRADLLELVFHELQGSYAMDIINGAGEIARKNGLALVLSESQGHHTPDQTWIDGVLQRRPTGVLAVFSQLSRPQVEQLSAHEVPLVLLDPTGEPGHQHPSVGAGNWNGGLLGTRHLLDLGHRRIAIITGPADILSSRARLDGYRTAMDTAGVLPDPALVRTGRFHLEDGLAHTRDLLRLPDPPTAIFTGNDQQALGVYQAAYEAGVRIPQDLSVVGFDDLPPARWCTPPLTTIRQPLGRMAATAAEMAISLGRKNPLAQTRIELPTELVIRASTAPPGPAA